MRRRQLTSNQPRSLGKLWAIFIIIIPVLAIVNVFLSAQVSDIGFQMADLYREKDELTEMNQRLETALFETSSLTKIMTAAESWGFDNNNNYLHLAGDPQVAMKSE